MKLKLKAFYGIFLLGFLLSCSPTTPSQQPLKMTTLAFGTWVDITIYNLEPKQAEVIGQQLDDALQKMHQDWHAWHPGTLGKINQALRQGETIELDPQMQLLIGMAMEMESKSRGLFNPAIGELLKLWGFQRDDPFNVKNIPSTQQIQQYLDSRPSTSQLLLQQNKLSSSNPKVQFDFGGFAKGFGIQLLLQQLNRQGYDDVLINAGGDLMVSGLAGSKPWNISISDPFSEDTVAKISLSGNYAVFTSGNYERGFEVDGVRYHHILNPFTGYPAKGIAAVTVIGKDGAWSDAAATALLLANVEQAFEIAPTMGVKHLLMITDDGHYHVDEGILTLIEFFDLDPAKLKTHRFKESL
jgi:thiamine biosynthesis lipoprotein